MWLVAVITGCLITGNELSSLNQVLPILGYDKLTHYGAYVGLAFLSILGFESRRGIVVALLMILVGALIKVAQQFSPGRTPEVADAVANSLGVFTGIALGRFVTTYSANQHARNHACDEVKGSSVTPPAVRQSRMTVCDFLRSSEINSYIIV